ncbi:MAG: PVC-type heme-binding CxxCH protein [Blastocatellia bacterium]
MNRSASFRFALPLLIALCFVSIACREEKKSAEQAALSPQQSLKSFRLSEDFRLELFLSEPQVRSPVEMVFDENGRIYVCEMLDYPDDPPPGKPARSRIRLLEDADGDGKYEKDTVFGDQLLQVASVLPWKGGVFVASAPNILWMKDNDGDGKADVKRVLYTGFPLVNPEHRITNFRPGVDNWIYAANNGNDGKITAPDQPNHPPVLIRGADFRFNPVTEEFETASGPAQYGTTFDEWGRMYIANNTQHVRHVVLPMQYTRRAPLLDVAAYAQDISDHGKPSSPMFPLTGPQEWRKQRTALRQQRYNEQNLNRTEHLGGYFTGASGLMAYSGDAWPAEYRASLFVGDVSANLAHRDVIRPDGVSFAAGRSKDQTEFLASTDVWARPCNFANGPDGNLYMMDVYRLFIETPESIPAEIKKGMDFYAGDTMGRIYRIAANKPRNTRDLKPDLGKADVAALVKLLEHENGWHRQTAQRLLLERQDKSAAPLLKQMYAETKSPLGKLHALWSLDGIGMLDELTVLQAMKEPVSQLREHALRLAEKFLAKSKPVQDAALALSRDADVRVRFQAAFTLGQNRDARALAALAALAVEHGGDPWFRMAILSSVNDAAAAFFQLLRTKHPQFENEELFRHLGQLIGGKQDSGEMAKFLSALAALKQPESALTGFAKALQLAGVKDLRVPGAETALAGFLSSPAEATQKAAWDVARFLELRALVEKAVSEAGNAALPPKQRVTAIRALRGGQFSVAAPILKKILDGGDPSEIKIAAVEALAAFDDPSVAATLLAEWKSQTPEVRVKTLDALLSERERMKALLAAVENGQVEKTAVGEERRARLYDHPDKATADQAHKLFAAASDDRAQVVTSYMNALDMQGDVAAGKKVFEANCAKCHIPQRQYGRIGPDLSGINNKTKEELLASILNPGLAIDPRFVNYIVTAKDGRIYAGVLASETPGTVTLRGLEGEVAILRKNIVEMKASPQSLMPGVFEMMIDRKAMADLIAYLRGGL